MPAAAGRLRAMHAPVDARSPEARPVRVLHFVTGGFSGGATQVAIALTQAGVESPQIEPLLVLRRKRRTDPRRIAELEQAGVPLRVVPGWSHAATIWALVQVCRFCGQLEASIAANERARGLDPHLSTSANHTYWHLGDLERAYAACTPGTFGLDAMTLLGKCSVVSCSFLVACTALSCGQVEVAVSTICAGGSALAGPAEHFRSRLSRGLPA